MNVKLFENITNPSTIVPKKEVIQVLFFKKNNYLNCFQFDKNYRKKKPRKQKILQKQKPIFHQ